MTKRLLAGVIFLLVSLLGNTICTGQWFAGLEAGNIEHEFRPEYTFVIGEPQKFINRTDGYEFGFTGGYRFSGFSERYFLSVQGQLSLNKVKWTFDIVDAYPGTEAGGPANFQYDIPAVFNISICPELILLKNFSITGEIGMGKGYIREKKESETSTSYDITEWTTCYSFGGGIKYRTGRKMDFYLMYRGNYFSRFSFESFFPGGLKWENISDKPVSSSLKIGILYSF